MDSLSCSQAPFFAYVDGDQFAFRIDPLSKVVGVSVNVWNAKRRLLERVLATSSKRRRSFESQASFEVGNSRVLDDKQLDLD